MLSGLLLSATTAVACNSDVETIEGRELPEPWHLTEAPDEGDLSVEALYGGSVCTEFRRWEVEESSTSVVVHAIVFRATGDCTDDLVGELHTVRLEEPLGDRPLLGCDPEDSSADCRDVNRLRGGDQP